MLIKGMELYHKCKGIMRCMLNREPEGRYRETLLQRVKRYESKRVCGDNPAQLENKIVNNMHHTLRIKILTEELAMSICFH